jgi:hypothetical protein
MCVTITGSHLEIAVSCDPGAPLYSSQERKKAATIQGSIGFCFTFRFTLPFTRHMSFVGRSAKACAVPEPCFMLLLCRGGCLSSRLHLEISPSYLAVTSRQITGRDLEMVLIDARQIQRRDFVHDAVGVNGVFFVGGSTVVL